MRIKIFSTLLILFSNYSWSANLVAGASVVKVGSTNWNERVFTITVSGGVGACVNKVISFPEDYSQSSIAYAQSQGMAMSAFLHNKKVNVHNYGSKEYKNGDICTGASSIEITD